jgi:hypothetical protein
MSHIKGAILTAPNLNHLQYVLYRTQARFVKRYFEPYPRLWPCFSDSKIESKSFATKLQRLRSLPSWMRFFSN